MDLKPLNPWQELEEAERQFEQISNALMAQMRQSIPGKAVAFVPPLDIVETTEEYRLYVVLPGMVEEDIDVLLIDEELVVRGEREMLYDPAGAKVLRRQIKEGYFERRLRLPSAVDPNELRATYEAGVLSITIRKTP